MSADGKIPTPSITRRLFESDADTCSPECYDFRLTTEYIYAVPKKRSAEAESIASA
jgi:hypothetical protein